MTPGLKESGEDWWSTSLNGEENVSVANHFVNVPVESERHVEELCQLPEDMQMRQCSFFVLPASLSARQEKYVKDDLWIDACPGIKRCKK
jgi:hypothetical protein